MNLRIALFVVAGAALGFAQYRFIGCRTGACAIGSNPYLSVLYGALVGYLLSGEFR